jgi:dinuclear metal center YbgI/SA1388 family protein
MKLKELVSCLNKCIPVQMQEAYDNSGLQCGDPQKEINSGLIAFDVTDEVLDEAISKKCNLIISHHPLIFGGIKSLTGAAASEKMIIKAIKNDLAVYSSHTNLDIFPGGVSRRMAEKMGLNNIKVLSPVRNRLLKLVTFVPGSHLSEVSQAVFNAGAGVIGAYDNCSFSAAGTGTFRAGEGTNPFTGNQGTLHQEPEIRFETILFDFDRTPVINALLKAHPYEEVAYDLYRLENDNVQAGLGCTGDLSSPLGEKAFLELAATVFDAQILRHSVLTGRSISKVAICGGAGSSLIKDALNSGADAYITADLKYHNFMDYGSQLLLADPGHYESENCSSEILYELIIKKFPTFALRFSEINTNPINYFKNGKVKSTR